jgi:hypothetical protein
MEALNILYVGENDLSTVPSSLETYSSQWNVMTPESAQEALAMYVLYFPDVIVIEGTSSLAREVFFHLSSGVTQASPLMVESMIVLADGERWEVPANTILKQIPANADIAALVWAIEDVSEQSAAEIMALHQRELA